MKTKPIVLVAIDSKYAHTNLAVRSIAAFARENGVVDIEIAEFTINQRQDIILDLLYQMDAGIYIFSCYIWNVRLVESVANELHKIRKTAILFAGGPEISVGSVEFLQKNDAFSGVLRGEGEESTAFLLKLWQNNADYSNCPGLSWRDGAIIRENSMTKNFELCNLPFAYEDIAMLRNRVIYYESSRGCPFRCAYCLSSLTTGVTFRSIALVKSDLHRFLEARVLRVKFVDRTFNSDKQHAMEIWQFLVDEDNGITNFHFELAGHLLDEEMLDFLATVRPGLFQFEIGVQSTNDQTLAEIDRPNQSKQLFFALRRLLQQQNIHLHLDLIAGLPFEDLVSFQNSFEQVYQLFPHQLQLGFLKVLRGSKIEKNHEAYKIIYRDNPPYEVLATKWMDYSDLQLLKTVELAVDLYYNSGRFRRIMQWMAQHFSSGFEQYRALGEAYHARKYHISPPSKLDGYELIGEVLSQKKIAITEQAQWLCKLDMMRHEKIRSLPSWVQVDGCNLYKEDIRNFYRDEKIRAQYLPDYRDMSPHQCERTTHLEFFPFDPVSMDSGACGVLIDYSQRDVDGQARIVGFRR